MSVVLHRHAAAPDLLRACVHATCLVNEIQSAPAGTSADVAEGKGRQWMEEHYTKFRANVSATPVNLPIVADRCFWLKKKSASTVMLNPISASLFSTHSLRWPHLVPKNITKTKGYVLLEMVVFYLSVHI